MWDACSSAYITFDADEGEDVSYIVENDLVLYALEQILQSTGSRIAIEYQSKIKNIKLLNKDNLVNLEMENGDKHTCRLLVSYYYFLCLVN